MRPSAYALTKAAILTVTVAVAAIAFADTGKATYRDAQGRNMGSASTDKYGKTTYRDAQGRIRCFQD